MDAAELEAAQAFAEGRYEAVRARMRGGAEEMSMRLRVNVGVAGLWCGEAGSPSVLQVGEWLAGLERSGEGVDAVSLVYDQALFALLARRFDMSLAVLNGFFEAERQFLDKGLVAKAYFIRLENLVQLGLVKQLRVLLDGLDSFQRHIYREKVDGASTENGGVGEITNSEELSLRDSEFRFWSRIYIVKTLILEKNFILAKDELKQAIDLCNAEENGRSVRDPHQLKMYAAALEARIEFENSQYPSAFRKLTQWRNLQRQAKETQCIFFNNLASIHMRMGKQNLCSLYLSKALESIDPNDTSCRINEPEIVLNVASHQIACGNYQQGFQTLERISGSLAHSHTLWLTMAEACIKESTSNQSLLSLSKNSYFREPVQRADGSWEWRLSERQTSENVSKRTSPPGMSLEYALIYLKNALLIIHAYPPTRRKPLENQTLCSMTYVALAAEYFSIAYQYALKLLKQGPLSAELTRTAHLYAAEALVNLERTNEAIDHLQNILKSTPNAVTDTITLCNLAACYLRSNAPCEADRLASLALKHADSEEARQCALQMKLRACVQKGEEECALELLSSNVRH